MSSGSRAAAACLALAGLALTAAFAVLSLHPFAPAPRWDLIGCFALAAVGVIGCLVALSEGAFPDLGGVSSLPWWPDVRALWKGIGRLIWLFLMFWFISAMVNFSPTAAQMAEEGHLIQQVRVDSVLSTERKSSGKGSYYYDVEVRTSIPYADGDKSRTGTASSKVPLRPGDRVWALYAPSAPQLGVFFDDDRADLVEKAGGPAAGMRAYGAPTLILTLLASGLMYTAPRLPGSIKSALKNGRVRRLPVRVVAGRATVDEKAVEEAIEEAVAHGAGRTSEVAQEAAQEAAKPIPRLLVEGPHGEQFEVAINKRVAPVEFARALADRPTALYWIKSGGQASEGVLVSGAHYVRCSKVTPADGTSLSAGETATAVAEAPGKPRRIHRFPEWDAEAHAAGFICLLFTLLILGIIALGVGLIASIVLGVLAYLASFVGSQMPSIERTDQLEKLVAGAKESEESESQ